MIEIKVINRLNRYVRTNIVIVNVVTYLSQSDTSVLYKLIEARAWFNQMSVLNFLYFSTSYQQQNF